MATTMRVLPCAFALAIGCSSGGGGSPTSDAWFQVDAGSVNVYSVTPPAGAASTQTITVTAASPSSMTRRVAFSTLPATYLEQTFALSGSAVAQTSQAAHDAADDALVGGTTVSYSPGAPMFPASADPGAVEAVTFTTSGGPVATTTTRTMTVGGTESVTVPAGTFTALKVTFLNAPSAGIATETTRWFVRGVGMVKATSVSGSSPGITTMELTAHTPGTGSTGGGGGGGGGGTPVALATGLVNAGPIAVDGTHVYWAESDGSARRVKKVPVAGGSVTVLVEQAGQDASGGISSIAVDATSVYWTQIEAFSQELRKVGLNGGTVTTLVDHASDPQSPPVPNALALDASNVYFTDTGGGVNWGRVRSVGKGGGATGTLASGLPQPWAIALDAANVYWIDVWDGTVRRAAKGGGGATTLATGATTAYGATTLAVDSTGVYFIASSGDVARVAATGGTVTSIASAAWPAAIAIDAANVYWTSGGVGGIWRAPKAGGPATHVAVTGAPGELALDAANAYWTDGSSVKKLAKW